MTPEERRLAMSLVVVPGRGPEMSPDEFLRRFGADDGREPGLALLRDAIDRRDGLDVEMALIVCATLGFKADHLPLLVQLIPADWHHKHEDVVTALGGLRALEAIDALYEAAQWVPEYLDYDESRALAKKAIRALSRIPGPAAERAMARLSESDSEIVREYAQAQFARRREA